jgi:acid phosphatase type 7
MRKFYALSILLSIFLSVKVNSQTTIFNYGATWSYSAAASVPANDVENDTWIETDYNDGAWSSGAAQFHVGESGSTDLVTLRNAFYFRKVVNITGLTSYVTFDLNIIRDDGVVVYVNGIEAGRNNMPAGSVVFSTNATAGIGNGSEATVNTISIASCYFTEGNNTVAVEVHQASTTGSDMRFDMSLVGQPVPASVTLSRGPYLQMGNQTEITVRFRTSASCFGKVDVGPSNGSYTTASVTETCPTTEHEVRITGLSADTKYFYRIGTSNQTLQGASDNYFRTLPASTPGRKLRFIAFGDCGRNSSTYQDNTLTQYQSFLTNRGMEAPDAWLLLGDNAYNAGTDAEYTSNFFGTYGTNILKNHKLYPAPGNHDYANSTTNQDNHTLVPYYDIFTLPENGEIGGVASGKEEFYSYDIGNVHFLALDAYGEESNMRLYDTTGAQAVWVKSDLDANTKKFTIAYWHHPPYTMGSHNSDSEGDLVAMRDRFTRIMERYGVDLIINGHSHDYERSYLIKGHYGLEATFNSGTMAVSTSSATYGNGSNCPYMYPSSPANHGTIYVVAGSTGASGSTQAGYPHNALPYSVNDGGVFYFEVENNRLDAKFLRRDGSIYDSFTVMKDVNVSTNYNINNGQSVNLTASWPGSYSWQAPLSGTTQSKLVTPAGPGIYNYSVQDAFGCITDNFQVTVSSTLPITMKNYTVNLRSEKVYVQWGTATELNNRRFIIQRSIDGRQFDDIGSVNGAGTTVTERNYEFIDQSPLTGVSFYRLAQEDEAGGTKYFDIKKIDNRKNVHFYGDITQSAPGTITMDVYSSKNENIRWKIIDFSGKVVRTGSWSLNSGSNSRQVSTRRGNYIVELKKGSGEAIQQKIIVY